MTTIDLDIKTWEMAIDACIIQNSGSIESVESRSLQAQRLTYHVGEHVCAKVNKMLLDRKFLKG